MIPTNILENRRLKALKLSKHLAGIYKESKCRDCTVIVTRMDFAKILGKFTKVKIQYEKKDSIPKSKRNTVQVSPNSRLRSNENGMVEVHRNAYNPHPAKKLLGSKKPKSEKPTPAKNILKENNRLKKNLSNFSLEDNEVIQYKDTNIKRVARNKLYHIVFENPINKKKEVKSTTSLEDLIPFINTSILPSSYWCIDYFPKNSEPKNDAKVYDRIAAELEDLMNDPKNSMSAAGQDKADDFPSIMDILNDTPKDSKLDQKNVCLESNDVEAMLLGKSDTKPNESTPMDVDNTDYDSSFLATVNALNNAPPTVNKETSQPQEPLPVDESPNSPSILEEGTEKESVPGPETETVPGPETETVPGPETETVPGPETETTTKVSENLTVTNTVTENLVTKIDENDNTNHLPVTRTGVTQIIFKKNVNGTCLKSVICPKNMNYNICLLGKPVELLGAPKTIMSIDDLQVLLQIVDESNLDNLYVLH